MHKLKKNIATAVALAMVISGFAPTAQAYSISNNSNNSIFSRIMSMLNVESSGIRRIGFANQTGGNISEVEQSVKSGDTLRIKIFGSGDSLNNVVDSDVKIKLIEVNLEGEPLNEVELTPEKLTKNKSTMGDNIANIIADIKVPNNDTPDEKIYTIKACVNSNKLIQREISLYL